MADLAQFRKRGKKPVEIEPDLKVFIDCVIVPILVKEYPEMSDGDNVLAHEGSDTAHFVSSTAAPAPGRRNPADVARCTLRCKPSSKQHG
jgi:hypothetical protein